MLLSLLTQAASVTAIVEAWNKASLSGDVTDAMSVSFLSTSKSAGRITAGNTAQMTISGLPACTVNAITLYVHSNQKSGAGLVALSLANQTWIVASGTFDQWPGMSDFTTTTQPMQGLLYPIPVKKNAQLTLLIKGEENSISVEQIVVDYSPTPPTAHTLTLQWLSSDGTRRSQQLTESQAGAGIDLPAVDAQDSVIIYNHQPWYWIGWCRPPISCQTTPPNYWETDDWFYLEEDCCLHGLYSTNTTYTLTPDSSFTSGEYALVYMLENPVTSFVLSGPWNDGTIALQTPSSFVHNEGTWTWTLSHLDRSMRYQLYFSSDSVAIYHPSSQTWIYHSHSAGISTYGKWAWRKVANHSIFIYGALQTLDTNTCNMTCLSVGYQSPNHFFGTYQDLIVASNYTYWYLFPLTDIPSISPTQYTTFADVSALPNNCSSAPKSGRKQLDTHGRIIILHNNQSFNLLGQPL